MAFGPEDVEVLSDEVAYQGFYQLRRLTLRHSLFEGGTSAAFTRELVIRHDAVGVLLYDPKLDSVALIEQFRVGAMRDKQTPWMLELVAGLIDKDESIEEVGRRESIEEAGVTVDELVPVYRYFSSPGGSTEYFHLYCGRADLSRAGGVHGLDDESEDIKVHVLSFTDCWQLYLDQAIANAHTLIAIQWLERNRDDLRSRWAD